MKKAELVVVAVGVAPVLMQSRDEGFGVLDAERVDRRSILLSESGAFEGVGGVASIRIVQIAKGKGAPESTDRVVVDLLVPRIRVSDGHQRGVGDTEKRAGAQVGTPHPIQDLAVGGHRDRGAIATCEAPLLVE